MSHELPEKWMHMGSNGQSKVAIKEVPSQTCSFPTVKMDYPSLKYLRKIKFPANSDTVTLGKGHSVTERIHCKQHITNHSSILLLPYQLCSFIFFSGSNLPSRSLYTGKWLNMTKCENMKHSAETVKGSWRHREAGAACSE